MSARFRIGDCREVLRTLPDESVQCCVTSPPYWGLRDYGVDGQIGLEATPETFVGELLEVFREVRRVLRADGTLWLNLGDCYMSDAGAGRQGLRGDRANRRHTQAALGVRVASKQRVTRAGLEGGAATQAHALRGDEAGRRSDVLKQKDLVGMPWRVAFALQADGWWLRSDIIWAKPNPMPESIKDRPTKAHEYVFLLTKSERYLYDADAIREPAIEKAAGNAERILADGLHGRPADHRGSSVPWKGEWRNRRSVWSIATTPFPDAHFATMPTALVEPCILAGSRTGDTVLDPFGGAGTVALVADRLQRDSISIELNPAYVDMAKRRLAGDAGMFADLEVVA